MKILIIKSFYELLFANTLDKCILLYNHYSLIRDRVKITNSACGIYIKKSI